MRSAKNKLQLTNPIHLLAVGFGSGLSPIVPGTMGSLAALLIWLVFLQQLTLAIYIPLLIGAFLIGIYLCQKTADHMGIHDHGSIVWDEFVGMWIVLLVIPMHNWQWMSIAFVLFRLFDMWKPWPISWFDRQVKGGLGIMLDDVVAGLIAAVVVFFLSYYPFQVGLLFAWLPI